MKVCNMAVVFSLRLVASNKFLWVQCHFVAPLTLASTSLIDLDQLCRYEVVWRESQEICYLPGSTGGRESLKRRLGSGFEIQGGFCAEHFFTPGQIVR